MARQVQLYVYDLTRGMASAMSSMLLGMQVEGVWHTGVVADGTEYFFGAGISRCSAGCTPFGRPDKVIDLGTTEVPSSMVEELLADMAPQFGPTDYSLLTRNCNHFSNEFAQLLTGDSIPDHILTQADALLSTPMGQMLMPMIMQLEGITGGATAAGLGGGLDGIRGSTSSSSSSRFGSDGLGGFAHNAGGARGTGSSRPSAPSAPANYAGAGAAADSSLRAVDNAAQPAAAAAAAAAIARAAAAQQGAPPPQQGTDVPSPPEGQSGRLEPF